MSPGQREPQPEPQTHTAWPTHTQADAFASPAQGQRPDQSHTTTTEAASDRTVTGGHPATTPARPQSAPTDNVGHRSSYRSASNGPMPEPTVNTATWPSTLLTQPVQGASESERSLTSTTASPAHETERKSLPAAPQPVTDMAYRVPQTTVQMQQQAPQAYGTPPLDDQHDTFTAETQRGAVVSAAMPAIPALPPGDPARPLQIPVAEGSRPRPMQATRERPQHMAPQPGVARPAEPARTAPAVHIGRVNITIQSEAPRVQAPPPSAPAIRPESLHYLRRF